MKAINQSLKKRAAEPVTAAAKEKSAAGEQVRLSLELSARGTAAVLGVIVLVLVGLSVAGHAGQFLWGEETLVEYVRIFNLGGEKNVPTWFTSILLFGCASLLWYLARHHRQLGTKRDYYWVGLASIFAFLSLDSVATLHDFTLEQPLVNTLQTRGFFLFPWVIVGWIFVAVFGLIYFNFWRRLPPRSRTLFLVAAVLYIGGGLVLEMVSAYMMDYLHNDLLLRGAVATIQEMAEMIGLVVFIYGLLIHINWLQEKPPA